MSEEDNWCWDQSAVELDVGTEDLEDIAFTQKGYWINIISTHDTKAYIEQPDSSRVDLLIKVSHLLPKFYSSSLNSWMHLLQAFICKICVYTISLA